VSAVQTVGSRIGHFVARRLRSPESYARYGRYGDFRAQSGIVVDSVPVLALALAAATASRLGFDGDDRTKLGTSFVAAVSAMDRADLAYLRTIEEVLPSDFGKLLSLMATFRSEVGRIRQRARDQIVQSYLRYGRSYGWFDPIDPYTPPATGLTHADETRIATIADGARSEVDELRASVNRTVVAHLDHARIEGLIAAKRRRRAAFEIALHQACGVNGKTLDELTELADGWY